MTFKSVAITQSDILGAFLAPLMLQNCSILYSSTLNKQQLSPSSSESSERLKETCDEVSHSLETHKQQEVTHI